MEAALPRHIVAIPDLRDPPKIPMEANIGDTGEHD